MSLNTQTDFPADVLSAIHANRKIEAIKLLREQRDLGLKEAKDAVEAYMRQHPALAARRRAKVVTGSGPLMMFIILILAAYAAYRLLS